MPRYLKTGEIETAVSWSLNCFFFLQFIKYCIDYWIFLNNYSSFAAHILISKSQIFHKQWNDNSLTNVCRSYQEALRFIFFLLILCIHRTTRDIKINVRTLLALFIQRIHIISHWNLVSWFVEAIIHVINQSPKFTFLSNW